MLKPYLHFKKSSKSHSRTWNQDLLPPLLEDVVVTPESRSWIMSLLSQRETLTWCLCWYLSNLMITCYNKHVLSSLHASAITNTMVHMCFTFIGCYIIERGTFPTLNRTEFIRIALFSFIYAVNVVCCQFSIKLIPLSLHQVSRAISPLFVALFTWIITGQQPDMYSLVPLIPVCCGVAMTASAELNLSLFALIVAISSVMLTSFKGVISMIILQRDLKEKLQEYSFLILVTPLAAMWLFCIQIIIALVSWFRISEIDQNENENIDNLQMGMFMAMGGVFGIMVNISGVGVQRRVIATSIGVMGNAKRALTIAGSMILVESGLSWKKMIGIIVTLSGATWYAYRKEMSRHQKLR